MTKAEAKAAYNCVKGELEAAYKKSGLKISARYHDWKRYNTVTYVSATHGGRHVNNYANRKAKRYGKFEKSGQLPKGSILAKDSFMVTSKGQVGVGPLFIMEKMGPGFSKASGDWRYTMVMPDGSVFGRTKGKGSAKVRFCAECHMAAAENDSMFFMPAEVRVR
ncbi:MAG: cytochrome P460 family protein [Alphaproteobacteria bacterium]|nr:cytochrome P460 family protein [Alphaproteobacteria bacterium]